MNNVARSIRVDPAVLKDLTWWTWLATVLLLAIRLRTGSAGAVLAAAMLSAAMAAVDLVLRRGDVRAMSIQIRIGYVLLLLAGLVPGMTWILWAQAGGIIVRLLTGYCPLHRQLLMLPWNLSSRLSGAVMLQILLMTPAGGGLLRFGDRPAESPCGMCG